MQRTRAQTAQEVAEILDVTATTVNRWIKSGAPHSTRGRRHFFDASEIAHWLKENNRTCSRGRPSVPTDPELLALKVRKELAIVERLERENRDTAAKYIDAEQERLRDAARDSMVRSKLEEFFGGLGVKLAGLDPVQIHTVLDSTVEAFLLAMSQDTSESTPTPAPIGAATI
jgi:predicted transcriptional regulator